MAWRSINILLLFAFQVKSEFVPLQPQIQPHPFPDPYGHNLSQVNKRLDVLEASMVEAGVAINTLVTNVTHIHQHMDMQISSLSTRITDLSDNLNAQISQVEYGVNQQLVILTADVVELTTSFRSVGTRLDKLEAINLIWQQNFRVVNRTFAFLRGKINNFNQQGSNMRFIPENNGKLLNGSKGGFSGGNGNGKG